MGSWSMRYWGSRTAALRGGSLCLLAWMGLFAGFAARAEETSTAAQGQRPADWSVKELVRRLQEQNGRAEPFAIDFAAYSRELRDLPIGVFDSGIGGLSVLQALLTSDLHDNRTGRPGPDGVPDFQYERFLYLGDQANMPYGNYPELGKTDFLRELILRDAVFLLGSRYYESAGAAAPSFTKPPVKAIVIACNTATAFGLDDIRGALEAWGLPVIVVGVVEAGAGSVIDRLPPGDAPDAVAVFATTGTCQSNAYPRAIHKIAGQRGRRLPLVWQQGSLGLAAAIEGDPSFVNRASSGGAYRGPSTSHQTATLDPRLRAAYGFETGDLVGAEDEPDSWQLNSTDAYIRYDVTSLVESYRQAGHEQPIRHVVLGCTHFPFEQDKILAALQRLRDFRDERGELPYRQLIAPDVELIDPALLTAKDLYRQLFLSRRLASGEGSVAAGHRVFVSVPSPDAAPATLTADGWYSHEYKYSRSAGDFSANDTRIVPLRVDRVPDATRRLIESRCPDVWRLVIENR